MIPILISKQYRLLLLFTQSIDFELIYEIIVLSDIQIILI